MGRPAKPQCQRCSTKHPATTTEKFSFSGSTYEIDLCEAQADALYRDFFSWARLGRDVSAVERARVSDEQRATKITFPVARRTEILDPIAEPVKTLRAVVSTLPPKAEEWRLSLHARERCTQRGITREQALWSAVDPATDLPHTTEPDLRVRKRGDTIAIVDPIDQEVITVWGATAPKDEQAHELDYATAHRHAS
jgi:hypothetical protein